MKKRIGFTLSEVLITLGVIGVIAAMTLPTLIKNYQKQATVTQLKKAYTELSQILQKAEMEHGLMETWNFANFNTSIERSTYFGNNYLFPNINIVKKCVPSTDECWASNVKTLDNKSTLANSGARISFVTASGYSVYYWLSGSGLSMWYWVDLNGVKKPNMLGHDIFAFQAYWGNSRKKGCFGAGYFDTNFQPKHEDLIFGENLSNGAKIYLCQKGKNYSSAGGFCSGLIMLDGWKIPDDYPW